MQFRVKYLNRASGDIYWRTVRADNENEAASLADRYQKRGFTWVLITGNHLQGVL